MIEEEWGGSIYSFESGVPSNFRTTSGSSLSICSTRSRDGKYSLQWSYSPGARLTIDGPIGFHPFVPNPSNQAIATFGLWVYSEQKSDQKLHFIFGRDEREDCCFEYGLNYTGWRSGRVAYERDMIGHPRADMKTITIVAPADGDGVLLFDQIITSTPVDPRHHTRDRQVPFVNMQADEAANSHWLGLLRMDETLQQWREKPEQSLHQQHIEAESASFNLVKKRWDDYLLQLYSEKQRTIEEQEQYYLQLLYQKDESCTRPRTIDYVHINDFYPLSRTKQLLELTHAADLREVCDRLLETAISYRRSSVYEERGKLHRWFIDTARHLDEQGWAWGSSQGTVHHLGYNMIHLYPAYFLMREVLQEEGLLEQSRNTLEWYSGLGRMAYPDDEIEGNADIFNTTLAGMLCSILLTSNEQLGIASLKKLQRWLELSIAPSRGLMALFKPDGAGYHHVNHYPAYLIGCLEGLTPVIRILSRTTFAVSESAHQMVRHVLLALRFYSNKTEWLIGLSSRHPTGKWALNPELYYEMALAGSPDGQREIDEMMGAAYLRLLPSEASSERTAKLHAAGISAEPAPNGHWTMNYACAAFHRREEWLVGVRGFSRYIWGNETYVNCNLYGRYIAYGHLEIMGSGEPINHADSGYIPEGWDWNHWPGTTTIHMPFDQLRSDVRNVDRFSGYEEMLISDETFAGGLSIDGKDGMFAMKLHEHGKYNGSHRARKSYYFFSNKIIALGSDIENDDTAHETDTTLFQQHMAAGKENITLSSDGVLEKFPLLATNKIDKAVWLLDTRGNGYYVPAGQQLTIARHQQTSRHQKDDSETVGKFASAWLSHGKAPKAEEYEYAIMVRSNEAEMIEFTKAQQQPAMAAYVVIRKDHGAHIVWEKESQTMAYSCFEAGDIWSDSDESNHYAGVLQTVDTPCMAMMREAESGQLRISVVDPDLRLYEGIEQDQLDEHGQQREVSLYSREWVQAEGAAHMVTMQIKGCWQLAQDDARVQMKKRDAQHTQFTVRCQHAQPVQFILTPCME